MISVIILRRYLIICAIAVCIDGVTQNAPINFRHIKSENGLSNSTIESILQDKRGFLWFGTRDGLNRYDGLKLTIYRSSTDTTSISDNYITSLFEDRDHYLWVGTLNGLNKFDPKLNKFKRLKHNLTNQSGPSSHHITTIYGDSKGRTWIGTFGGGVNLYNTETNSFKKIPLKHNEYKSGQELKIYTFLEDTRGNLWA